MKLIGEVVEISIDDLVINNQLKNANPQRTAVELSSLEEQIRAEGKIRDPLLVWIHEGQNLIVDGFGRYDIVSSLHQNENFSPIVRAQLSEFESIDEARYWIGINQDAKRNLTDEQKNYYYGQLMDELRNPDNLAEYLKAKGRDEIRNPNVAELVSELHRISQRTAYNALSFYEGIEKIKKSNPTLGAAILSRQIVDDMGEQKPVSMDLVRKFSKVQTKKAITKLEDISNLVKGSKEKAEPAAKQGDAAAMELVQESGLDPVKLLNEYLKAPSRKGLDSLVSVLEEKLNASARKAA